MHKSAHSQGVAAYPFHYDRYAVPHLFWPYLIPRQMSVQDDSSGPLFWGDIHESFYGITEGGIVNENRDSAVWYLIPISTIIPRECKITLTTFQNVPGAWEIYCHVSLQRGDILNPYSYTASGFRTVSSPAQPEVLISHWQSAVNVITGEPIATPRLQYRQATWFEIG